MRKVLALRVLLLCTFALLLSWPPSVLQAATSKTTKKLDAAGAKKTSSMQPKKSASVAARSQDRREGSPSGLKASSAAGKRTAATARTGKVQKKRQPAAASQKSPPSAQSKGVYHRVKKGQTLFGISRTYHVSIDDLVKANHLAKPSALQIGQRLLIPGVKKTQAVKPFQPLSVNQRKDLVKSLEEEQNDGGELTEVSPATSMAERPEDAQEVPPAGERTEGEKLELALAPAPAVPSPEITPREEQGGFIWPLINRITSRYGWRGRRMHHGIDIAAPSYHEVVAAADGEVIHAARSRKGLGNAVVLQHDHGYTTVYGHGVVLLVQEGDAVRRGEPIMGVGNTGRSTGNHLHFEIRKDGTPMDPLSLLPPTLDELIRDLRAEGR